MTKIELEIHDDVISTINKIKNINDDGIDLVIPEGSILFENVLSLKLINQQAQKYGIAVQFTTSDEAGNTLISMLEEKPETLFSNDEGKVIEEKFNVPSKKRGFVMPVLPKFRLRFPKIGFGNKGFIFIILGIVALGAFYFFWGSKSPKAQARIVLNTQALTRSVTIKVGLSEQTDPAKNTLKGTGVNTTIEGTMEASTTGTKLIGDKATGKVTLYNKTDSEVTLKKNTTLIYKSGDVSLNFLTDDEISIPAAIAGSNPGDPNVNGETSITVTANDIGGSYNIDKNKSLEVNKYKKTAVEAKSTETFKGGKSESVKVVAAADLTSLSQKLMTQNAQGAETALKALLKSPLKLISGATKALVTKDTFNYKVGDEASTLSLTQTISASGLAYSDTELNGLLTKMIDKLAPSGFTLSKTDWVVSVAVLGNSSSSVLSATEADIQVSLKTSAVPNINQDEIKNQLAGKTSEEALKYLGGIRNIKGYELKVTPAIPFFKKVPSDVSRIDLVIANE